MTNLSDFVIEDGVLKKYRGSGGDVTIPSGVTSIGERAFWYCSGLTSAEIPKSVTSIGRRAFEGCSGLTSIGSSARKALRNIIVKEGAVI